MKTNKKYDIWYEYSNGSIYVDITLKKAKSILKRLIDTSKTEDIKYFRFFMIKEANSDNYVSYYPSTGIVQNIDIIKNPTSRKAIQNLFNSATKILHNKQEILKNEDIQF